MQTRMKSLVTMQTHVQSLPTMQARMKSLVTMQTHVQNLPSMQARMKSLVRMQTHAQSLPDNDSGKCDTPPCTTPLVTFLPNSLQFLPSETVPVRSGSMLPSLLTCVFLVVLPHLALSSKRRTLFAESGGHFARYGHVWPNRLFLLGF